MLFLQSHCVEEGISNNEVLFIATILVFHNNGCRLHYGYSIAARPMTMSKRYLHCWPKDQYSDEKMLW